jgi:hypothetical protein
MLALPSANGRERTTPLFVSAEGDSDLFASADGISGTIAIKQSSFVTVKVGDQDEELASQVEATGQLVGQNVPVTTVRSLATLIGLLSRTFFGA